MKTLFEFLLDVVEKWNAIPIRVCQKGEWQSLFLSEIEETGQIVDWIKESKGQFWDDGKAMRPALHESGMRFLTTFMDRIGIQVTTYRNDVLVTDDRIVCMETDGPRYAARADTYGDLVILQEGDLWNQPRYRISWRHALLDPDDYEIVKCQTCGGVAIKQDLGHGDYRITCTQKQECPIIQEVVS